jgi:hypothetical protein
MSSRSAFIDHGKADTLRAILCLGPLHLQPEQFVFDFLCLFFGEPYRWSALFQPCRLPGMSVPNHPAGGSFSHKIARQLSHFLFFSPGAGNIADVEHRSVQSIPRVTAERRRVSPRWEIVLIENSANQVQHVRGCENPDRNRLAVDSSRPLPKAQTALAGCPGAKESLGGRAVLALCRGRCAMSRAFGLKSAATCLSAGSDPPAAQSVNGHGCQKPKPKAPPP